MTRKDAIPLIGNAISSGVWRKYLNPLSWQYSVNFPDSLLEMFNDVIPDFMDQMQFLAGRTKEHVANSPIELIDVPTSSDALMGQLEFVMTKPVNVTICVVYFQGEFWVQEKEFFPFDNEPRIENPDDNPKKPKASVASQIHYYDVEHTLPDKGWVHYTSRVPGWEGVDARVADVVRSAEDISSDTMGFLSQTMPTQRPTQQEIGLLVDEAVRISQFAPTWLDRIMTRSPIRDHELWRSERKALYLKQRQERRKKFKEGKLRFISPNKKLAD